MPSNLLFWLIWIPIVSAIFLAGLIAQRRYAHRLKRAPQLMQAWAQANGYVIHTARKKSKSATTVGYTGPFNDRWYKSPVFRVVVTQAGVEGHRVAWIRVGDEFKVVWDDEWRLQVKPIEQG